MSALPRVLLLEQGAPGGVGRIERLIEAICRQLEMAGRIDLRVVRKTDTPDYQERQNAVGAGVRAMVVSYATTVARWRPDLALFGHVNLTPLALALPFPTRTVCVAYGIDIWRQLSWIRRQALRGMTRVWAISQYTAQAARTTHALSADRLRHIPLALEHARLAPLAALPPPAPRGSTRFLTITRLDAGERYKGVDLVLEALARLERRGVAASLTVAGDGTDADRLRDKGRRLGLLNTVCWETIGFNDHQRLAELMAASDVFVLPSSEEGFGLVYLEAMAAARPVIAANAAATPEVVVSGHTGLLVPPGDVECLTLAMTELAHNRSLASDLGANGRAKVLRLYTEQNFVDRIAGLLIDALKEG